MIWVRSQTVHLLTKIKDPLKKNRVMKRNAISLKVFAVTSVAGAGVGAWLQFAGVNRLLHMNPAIYKSACNLQW